MVSSHRHRRATADPDRLLGAAVSAWRVDQPRFDAAIAALLAQVGAALPLAEQRLDAALDRLWEHGWTPADVVHVVGRQLTKGHAEVVAARAVVDGRRRTERGRSLHPRWRDQLADLQDRVAAARAPDPEERLRRLVAVIGLTARLPPVTATVPPPGGNRATGGASAHLDARTLARVRALLAKAESTTFEEEAEALTAKAQELIARHAIDEASLHTVDDAGEPSVRRLLLEDPYADAKSHLIAEVAAANRCRAVHSPRVGWVTVFGYEHDLDAVELLVASLLVQATAAMVRQGPRRDAAGRSRTRSFRRAFLLGFAQRIGERLRRATEEQLSAAGDRAGRFAPVLATREERIAAAERTAFPEIERRTVSVTNAAGWSAGRAAADLAELGVPAGRLPEG